MFIDLSVTLNNQTPVYPGDPNISIDPAMTFANEGCCGHNLSLGTHIGTHIDAPQHMIEGAKTLDKFPVDRFIGKGWLVDVSTSNDGFEAVKSLSLQAGDIVLFRTGMSDKYHDPSYFEDYPVMPESVAQYLVEVGVSMVGVDTCSVDIEEGFPLHKILSGGELLIIENLTNLDQLTGKTFKIYALPLNLQVDGSPARVVAETL